MRTALRELHEEVGGENFKILHLNEFYRQEKEEEKENARESTHVQYFYLVDLEGDLREEMITEKDGTDLYAPFYEDVRKLYRSDSFLPSHRKALKKAILLLAHDLPAFAHAADELGIAEGEGQSLSDQRRSVTAP